MISRTVAAITALIALAVATTVAVVAAAFALYTVLEPIVGVAGASALVALLFGLVVVFAVLLTASRGKHHHHDDGPQDHGDFDLVGKIFDMARQKPILAAAGAVAAGLLAIRNPALVATLVAAFMEKPKGPRR